MIQYIAMLITCECNGILFHVTPHHHSFHCDSQLVSYI